MTFKIPANVVLFAGGEQNLGVYKMFRDYWNQYRTLNQGAKNLEFATTTVNDKGETVSISFAEKEEAMNSAFKREILRMAGITNMSEFPLETWASHPVLKWATFAIVSAMVDMILPDVLIESVGLYSDIRTIGWGDSAAFDVEPRDLFVVSKAGRGKRTTEIHKQFKGQVVINPEQRELTVGVSLYRVLAGKESLAEFVAKVVRSFEYQFTVDIYTAFAAALAAVSATAVTGLRVTGYTQSDFVNLAQKVTAWNGGAKAIAIGTLQALSTVLPLDANYRYDIDSEFVKVGYVRTLLGVDLMVLPQVADWTNPFALKLSDTDIWIISPSSQKIVKAVLEGSTLAYTSDVYANANLVQTSTMTKSWGTGIATNSVGARIDIS
jgi:hypothetical protein